MTPDDSRRDAGGSALSDWLKGTRPGPAYLELLGATLQSVETGRTAFTWQPTAALLNLGGHVQGGFVTTFIDLCSFTAAVSTVEAGTSAVSISLGAQFLRAISTSKYRGEGWIVQSSRRLLTADAAVFDESGQLCARGTHQILLMR